MDCGAGYGGAGVNFGDQITPHILRTFYNAKFERSTLDKAELVSTGSLLEMVPENFTGTIIGTGFITDGPNKTLPNAKVLSARGKLTAERIGRNIPLGDPGLIFSKYFSRKAEEYEAIIPHYVDKHLPAQYPQHRLINVLNPVETVVDEISRASLVISSSLHGIVLADALGVPRIYQPHPSVLGSGYKFADYMSSLGMELREGVIEQPNSEIVQVLAENTEQAFSEFLQEHENIDNNHNC